MRGTAVTFCVTVLIVGIIPACAGNSVKLIEMAERNGDHPRVCGEQEQLALVALHYGGSSPRVRGTVCILELSKPILGIIHACAGNSL